MKLKSKIALLTLPFLIWASCQNDLNAVKETASLYEPAKETGTDIEMLYSDWGVLKIKLQAPKVIRHRTENPYMEFPEGVHLFFYDNQKNVNSELKAGYAIRYENTLQTVFRDSVYVVNVDNETLLTDELIWDEQAEKIYSDKFVRVITADERLTGTGFEANQDFTNYKIKNITGVINVTTDKTNEDL